MLAGGNGAGKTQLLKLISGAVWPTPTGREVREYHWRGERWPTPFEVKDEIGYLGPERQDKYERYGWDHTVAEVVGTGLYRTDIPLNSLDARDRGRIEALLRRLAIKQLARRRFLSLSYGERRLVLLARTLASRPKLLLLDELLNGLDEINHTRALRWLEGTGRSSLPWVLTTHRVEDIPESATPWCWNGGGSSMLALCVAGRSSGGSVRSMTAPAPATALAPAPASLLRPGVPAGLAHASIPSW